MTLRAYTGQAVSSNGKYVATFGMDSRLFLWLHATGEQVLDINTATPPENFPRFISFSPDGEKITAPTEDSLARVWDVTSGEPLLTLTGHKDIVTAFAYNKPGTLLATASMDSLLKVWNAENGGQLLSLQSQADRVNSVAFSPDGSRLASASRDGTSRVYALGIDHLLSIATDRVTRNLTEEECRTFLHLESCPVDTE